ncbi:MAG: LamG domain-containing protein, partial [Verrucomicrobiae bacterium]|nr:LamG domain-containing protein [Verrucomicrobiae bacterium]MCB1089487.1 LamG domain-containing protein [Verrucomicrobiae bacterium]
MISRLPLICLGTIALSCVGKAADSDPAAKTPPPAKAPATYGDQIRQMLPVAWWSFDTDKPEQGEIEGSVELGKPGPTSKQFRSFPDNNRAAAFTSKDGKATGFIQLEDVGAGSQFDFDNGDPITIEAWVNPDADLPKGANMYILGKGRTSNPGVEANNQNYGFRVFESGGFLKLSWLFRSRAEADKPGDWHRWDSNDGFKAGSGWHHVAISYLFGDPDSIRGYIDGEAVTGIWSSAYAGGTKRPPVVDDDDIWVGTSGGKNASVTFHGLLDEVALYRRLLTEEQLADRFPMEPYTPKL